MFTAINAKFLRSRVNARLLFSSWASHRSTLKINKGVTAPVTRSSKIGVKYACKKAPIPLSARPYPPARILIELSRSVTRVPTTRTAEMKISRTLSQHDLQHL